MPQIITTTVFTIDELSDAAREKARAWYREDGVPDEWYDYLYNDFETICRIIGITLNTSPVRLYGGGTRERPHIWFRGFWSQGDGACYEGTYSYAPGAAKALRAHAPNNGILLIGGFFRGFSSASQLTDSTALPQCWAT